MDITQRYCSIFEAAINISRKMKHKNERQGTKCIIFLIDTLECMGNITETLKKITNINAVNTDTMFLAVHII